MGCLKLTYNQGVDLQIKNANSELTTKRSKKTLCSGYLFSYQGKEKLDEITGVVGSHLDFGARIYDSRIGRWLSLDPLMAKYPDLSPYNFSANNPILFVDRDGKEIWIYYKNEKGENQSYLYGSKIEVPNNEFVKLAIEGLDYLKNNGLETEINQLANDERQINLYQGNSSYTTDDVSYWNPFLGKSLATGEDLPPIVGLSNEMGHQWFRLFIPNPTQKEIFDDGFTNNPWEHPKDEEKRGESYNPTSDYKQGNGFQETIVISKFDNKLLNSTGKPPRAVHKGNYIETSNPYSTEPSSDGPIKEPVGPVANTN